MKNKKIIIKTRKKEGNRIIIIIIIKVCSPSLAALAAKDQNKITKIREDLTQKNKNWHIEKISSNDNMFDTKVLSQIILYKK